MIISDDTPTVNVNVKKAPNWQLWTLVVSILGVGIPTLWMLGSVSIATADERTQLMDTQTQLMKIEADHELRLRAMEASVIRIESKVDILCDRLGAPTQRVH